MHTLPPPTPPPTLRTNSTLGWLLALVAVGVALVAAVLVFDLANQRTRWQHSHAQMTHEQGLREAELARLAVRKTAAEAEVKRLADSYAEGETTLRQLSEAHLKRESLVEQSSQIQKKLQDLLTDLIILAETDSEARAMLAKYDIRQNAAPPAGGAK